MKIKTIDNLWQRVFRTFVQAFFGIAVPELVAILNGGFDLKPGDTIWAIILPILVASLSAGISAAWGVIQNWLAEKNDTDNTDNNN